MYSKLLSVDWDCVGCVCADSPSGLDNAGKTTIVKKIMNEDVTTVSPTLGFIIKTIDFMGYAISLVFMFLFWTIADASAGTD